MKIELTVIVAVHNEEEALPGLLKSLQLNPGDEILFVLDRCTDSSASLIHNWQTNASKTVITLDDNPWKQAPKKFAILSGILASSHEHLVFTDADCVVPANWATLYREAFSHADVVIGFSLPPVESDSGPIDSLQLADALITAVTYRSLTLAGLPYMSVGRNWGYHKSLFHPDFLSSHQTIRSGDDDLLFQKLMQKPGIRIGLLDNHQVSTRPVGSWRALFRQKIRHYQAGIRYPLIHQLILPIIVSWFFLFLISLTAFACYRSSTGVGGVLLLYFVIHTIWVVLCRKLLKKLTGSVIPVIRLWWSTGMVFFLYPLISVFSHFLKSRWK